jgi:hypothetical protein
MHGVIGDAERLAEDTEEKGGEWEGRAGRQEDENRDQGGLYYVLYPFFAFLSI